MLTEEILDCAGCEGVGGASEERSEKGRGGGKEEEGWGCDVLTSLFSLLLSIFSLSLIRYLTGSFPSLLMTSSNLVAKSQSRKGQKGWEKLQFEHTLW